MIFCRSVNFFSSLPFFATDLSLEPANSDNVKASAASVLETAVGTSFGTGSISCFSASLAPSFVCALAAIPVVGIGFFACSALNPGGGPAGGPPEVCVSVETPLLCTRMANAGICEGRLRPFRRKNAVYADEPRLDRGTARPVAYCQCNRASGKRTTVEGLLTSIEERGLSSTADDSR